MARPRAFDEDKALDAAITCFWRRGLEATSVRDLAAEMGINGPSLYNAFGDKRALFVRALERYADRSMRERIRLIEGRHPPKAAIAEFFREMIAMSLADKLHRGCFIINSALEVAPHDTALRAVVCAYLGELEDFFHRCLMRAKADKTVPSRLDPQDTARMLLGVQIGLRVMARARPERAVLEAMVRPALATLDRPAGLHLEHVTAKGTA